RCASLVPPPLLRRLAHRRVAVRPLHPLADQPPLHLIVQLRVAPPQRPDDPGDLLTALVLVPVEHACTQHLVEQLRPRLAVRRFPLVRAWHPPASSRVAQPSRGAEEAHPAPPRPRSHQVAARAPARRSPPCAPRRGGSSWRKIGNGRPEGGYTGRVRSGGIRRNLDTVR